MPVGSALKRSALARTADSMPRTQELRLSTLSILPTGSILFPKAARGRITSCAIKVASSRGSRARSIDSLILTIPV